MSERAIESSESSELARAQRWEYMTLAQQDAKHIEEKFNALGQEGWEYVAMGFQGLKGHHIFKRPL